MYVRQACVTGKTPSAFDPWTYAYAVYDTHMIAKHMCLTLLQHVLMRTCLS